MRGRTGIVYQPVPHTDPMCCSHVVVPTETAVFLIIVGFAFFCVSQVKLRLQMTIPCFKLLLVVPGSVHVRCVVQKWHWDALYFQLFLFHLSASLYHCSMFVVIQALLSNWEPSKKGVVGPSDGYVLPHLQASDGTRVQARAQHQVLCRCHSPRI